MRMHAMFPIAAVTFGVAMMASANDAAVIHFLNGDSLPGQLDTLERDRFTWESPVLAEPATFFVEKIRELRMPSQFHAPDSESGHEATVTLTNGDVIRGQLASVAAETIILDTWFAGRLSFRRVMVKDLSIREMPEYIYRGPQASDTWIQSADPPAWEMNDSGGLTSTRVGGIAKEIPLPEEFTLEFEAEWQSLFRMHLVLFSDDLSTDSPDRGYELAFQRQSVHLRRCGERQWIGHSNRAIELQQNEKARIRIRASSRTGQFAFYVNDRLIDAWTDEGIDASTLGSALHFVSRDNSPITISRIDLSTWNGVLEETLDERRNVVDFGMGGIRGNWWDPAGESTEEIETQEEGTMALKNGDRIRGTVKAIKEGMITIETTFREVSLPVERLRTLALAPADYEEPKLESGDVRAWFPDGGSIVFRLDGMADDGVSVKGYSQTFGNAVFSLTAFNRMQFNIHDFFREDEWQD